MPFGEYLPFNKLVIFNTTDFSFHGHPEPLKCPDNVTRKSLALYYYTNGRPKNEINFDTINYDDQKRTLTAKEAIDLGEDIIVVGRPITSAESPGNAAEKYFQSIK